MSAFSKSLFKDSTQISSVTQNTFTLHPTLSESLPEKVALLTLEEYLEKYGQQPLMIAVRPVQGDQLSILKQLVEEKLDERIMHMIMIDCIRRRGYHFNDPIGNSDQKDEKNNALWVDLPVSQSILSKFWFLDLSIPEKQQTAALNRARIWLNKQPEGQPYDALHWNCQHAVFHFLGGQYATCMGQTYPLLAVGAHTVGHAAKIVSSHPKTSLFVGLAGVGLIAWGLTWDSNQEDEKKKKKDNRPTWI